MRRLHRKRLFGRVGLSRINDGQFGPEVGERTEQGDACFGVEDAENESGPLVARRLRLREEDAKPLLPGGLSRRHR